MLFQKTAQFWNHEQTRKIFLLLFTLCCVAYLSLFKSDYYYFDDIVRKYSYRLFDEGVHGRIFVDQLTSFIYAGIHTDASPFTQIFLVFVFSLASVFVFFGISGRLPRKHSDLLLLFPFAVSPYAFMLILYRFDSLWFGMSLFLVSVPFILNRNRFWPYLAVGTTSLWLSFCLYQPLSNIYLTVALFIILRKLVSRTRLQAVMRHAAILASPYLLSLVLYVPAYIYTRQTTPTTTKALDGTKGYAYSHSALPDLKNMLFTVYTNSKVYFRTLYADWGQTPPTLFVTAAVLVLVLCLGIRLLRSMRRRNDSLVQYLLRSGLFVVCVGMVLVAPYGIMLGLQHPVWHARTYISVIAFVLCMNVLLYSFFRSSIIFRTAHMLVLAYMCLWSTIFVASCGNMLTAQNEYNLSLKGKLIDDLNTLRTTYGIKEVICTGGIGQPPSAYPFVLRYPILDRTLDGMGDLQGWLFYAAKRYAGMHYLYPFSVDLNEVKTHEILLSRVGYTVYKISTGRALIDLQRLPGWDKRGEWAGSNTRSSWSSY